MISALFLDHRILRIIFLLKSLLLFLKTKFFNLRLPSKPSLQNQISMPWHQIHVFCNQYCDYRLQVQFFFTFVPGFGARFTGKSLITIILSPLFKILPYESLKTFSSFDNSSFGYHS